MLFTVAVVYLLHANTVEGRGRGKSNGVPKRIDYNVYIPGDCAEGQPGEYVDEISREFCCVEEDTLSCEVQLEFYIIDAKERQSNIDNQKNADAMNDVIGEVIKWIIMVLCILCCPICIGLLICNCIMKRRAAAFVEKKYGSKGQDFDAGQNMADS